MAALDLPAGQLMALTTTQEHILRVFAGLDGNSSFALVGGGAMNVHGVIDRPTHDLDLFTPEIQHIKTIADALSAALEYEGSIVERVREFEGFVQLHITNETTATIVELAHDYRWLDPIQTNLGLVLDTRELAADKLCAMFSRAETRDVIDVNALSKRFSVADMAEWAKEKDTGFDVARTIGALTSMEPVLDGYNLSLADFNQIRVGLLSDLDLAVAGPPPSNGRGQSPSAKD